MMNRSLSEAVSSSTATNASSPSGSASPNPWARDVDREALNKTAMGRALTAEKAIAIYRLRPEMKTPGRLRRGAMAHCKIVAPQFSVSAKTVREIWSGRSWARITQPEWTKAEMAARAEN
ncbi:hypothetical protein T484DRAFT_1892829 [Baffinella frigidus]|nr:hypothetical protein T484DRAFT_1892829 [Cryptophyta sp. CCMP2293]